MFIFQAGYTTQQRLNSVILKADDGDGSEDFYDQDCFMDYNMELLILKSQWKQIKSSSHVSFPGIQSKIRLRAKEASVKTEVDVSQSENSKSASSSNTVILLQFISNFSIVNIMNCMDMLLLKSKVITIVELTLSFIAADLTY